MTLLEAVASGQAFRVRGSNKSFLDPNFDVIVLTKLDILSGDWELSSDNVMIAREELEALRAKADKAP